MHLIIMKLHRNFYNSRLILTEVDMYFNMNAITCYSAYELAAPSSAFTSSCSCIYNTVTDVAMSLQRRITLSEFYALSTSADLCQPYLNRSRNSYTNTIKLLHCLILIIIIIIIAAATTTTKQQQQEQSADTVVLNDTYADPFLSKLDKFWMFQ